MKHLLATFGVMGVIFAGAPAFGQTADLSVDASYTSTNFLDYLSVSQPGGLVTVSTTFHKPLTSFELNQFYSLRALVTLPAGWTIDASGAYDGDGAHGTIVPTAVGVTAAPELDLGSGVDFVWTGSFGTSALKQNAARDFTINFSVHVPQGDTGTKNISVQWFYYWEPLLGEASLMAEPDPAAIADNTPAPKMGTVIFGR
jgi:hypothetical protein